MPLRSKMWMSLCTSCLIIFGSSSSSYSTVSKKKLSTTVHQVQPLPTQKKHTYLRVMTLNIAHGGNNFMGLPPFLRGAQGIRTNLQQTAAVLKRERPDVVGLQEADASSWWSGQFHHVHYLAKRAGYPFSVHGIHVKDKGKAYGTALLSRSQPKHARSHIFNGATLFPKGFVIASVPWPGLPKKRVDIISLHLHPTSRATQRAQVLALIRFVLKRKRPHIIVGDFNCQWYGKQSPLRLLKQKLGLHTYRPFNPYYNTHRTSNKRIDWIFVPKIFVIRNYRVLKDQVSDHYPVVADIYWKRWAPPPKKPTSAPTSHPSKLYHAPPL